MQQRRSEMKRLRSLGKKQKQPDQQSQKPRLTVVPSSVRILETGSSTSGRAVTPNASFGGGARPFHVGPFNRSHRILLVGEADFSFAIVLAASLGAGADLWASSYDNLDDLLLKYTGVVGTLSYLRSHGAKILHSVNAKQLAEHPVLSRRRFHRIVFNFPHLGGNKPSDIGRNQDLIRSFLTSAKALLFRENDLDECEDFPGHEEAQSSKPAGKPKKNTAGAGQILIALRSTEFYDRWNVEALGKEVGMTLVRKMPFDFEQYGGYTPQRTKPSATRPNAPSTNNAFYWCFAVAKEQDQPIAKASVQRPGGVRATSSSAGGSSSSTTTTGIDVFNPFDYMESDSEPEPEPVLEPVPEPVVPESKSKIEKKQSKQSPRVGVGKDARQSLKSTPSTRGQQRSPVEKRGRTSSSSSTTTKDASEKRGRQKSPGRTDRRSSSSKPTRSKSPAKPGQKSKASPSSTRGQKPSSSRTQKAPSSRPGQKKPTSIKAKASQQDSKRGSPARKARPASSQQTRGRKHERSTKPKSRDASRGKSPSRKPQKRQRR